MAETHLSPTPADLPAARPDQGLDADLARLDDLDHLPLAEHVAVFDAIHARLSARLAGAER
ncbi:hypothetical protein MF406_07425 [Georgenia sp. TF02-10]|uniref:hypothetical protein n=1 Tax=Georgenia sp. TF02-10 TaxID=2917725 RepID=UPI001FA7370C|nr:hypothetical protein [Georgenia sp. TF02-10]UNX56033.1 hypothetical protein MF406_07425 [Georgenia sp. TF02-10]